MEYVALDFETANRQSGGACAIGMVRFDMDGNPLDSFYSLLHPRVAYFDPWMSRVHKLRSEECLAAPTFPELWDSIHDFIHGDLVCAHNAAFDMGVLARTLEVYGISSDPITYVCTCNLARRLWRGLSSYSLSSLVSYLELQDLRHHHALDDALMCGKLLHRECGGHLSDAEDLGRFLVSKGYLPKQMLAGFPRKAGASFPTTAIGR